MSPNLPQSNQLSPAKSIFRKRSLQVPLNLKIKNSVSQSTACTQESDLFPSTQLEEELEAESVNSLSLFKSRSNNLPSIISFSNQSKPLSL